jgi:methanogenic corrinoid protein MtbC1
MIRWCMYCQAFIGERAPYDDTGFSHGICAACDARVERDEPVKRDTELVRTLMNQLLMSARAGDERGCEAFIEAAVAAGVPPGSLCVGLLQPALYQVGLDWQGARMSVAAEHRFTAWCERVFAMLPSLAPPQPPLDLLILSAPGNAHVFGPRVAGRVLAERGYSVAAIVPALPFEEVRELAKSLRPRVIGFSCAVPSQIAVATEWIARLRASFEPDRRCRYIVSGFALRMSSSLPTLPDGVEALVDLEDFSVGSPIARAC